MQLQLLFQAGQERVVREYDDLLSIIRAGVREGVTDVGVALKLLRRTGPPSRVRAPKSPDFDELWAKVDVFGDRVRSVNHADR